MAQNGVCGVGCPHTSYVRSGLASSAEATWSGPLHNPDMANGLEFLRHFNELHKTEQLYSVKFVIVQQMLI